MLRRLTITILILISIWIGMYSVWFGVKQWWGFPLFATSVAFLVTAFGLLPTDKKEEKQDEI